MLFNKILFMDKKIYYSKEYYLQTKQNIIQKNIIQQNVIYRDQEELLEKIRRLNKAALQGMKNVSGTVTYKEQAKQVI